MSQGENRLKTGSHRHLKGVLYKYWFFERFTRLYNLTSSQHKLIKYLFSCVKNTVVVIHSLQPFPSSSETSFHTGLCLSLFSDFSVSPLHHHCFVSLFSVYKLQLKIIFFFFFSVQRETFFPDLQILFTFNILTPPTKEILQLFLKFG